MLRAIAIEQNLVSGGDNQRQPGLCESYKQLAEDYEAMGDTGQAV